MKWANMTLSILLLAALFSSAAAGRSPLSEGTAALKSAGTFDQQLEILNRIALEHADELEEGGWENELTVPLAPGLSGGLIPEDWAEKMTRYAVERIRALRGRKFIALYIAGEEPAYFAGDLLARLPLEMRAVSMDEAEYALIVRWRLVKPDKLSKYDEELGITDPGSDRIYEALAADISSGEKIVFWTWKEVSLGKQEAKLRSQGELWEYLHQYFYPLLRAKQADGTELIFQAKGTHCYLIDALSPEVSAGLSELIVPAQAEGYAVTKLRNIFSQNVNMLRKVELPDGLVQIDTGFFHGAGLLENITLPETLGTLGDYAFASCKSLRQIELPGSLEKIGRWAFDECTALERAVVREGITHVASDMFSNCPGLKRIYLPSTLQVDMEKGGDGARGLLRRLHKNGVVVYAPKDSAVYQAIVKMELEYVACDDPTGMP